MASFVDWFGKEQHRGTPVVVKMENTNFSLLEVESPGSGSVKQKGKGKNAKQLTWVLLLKAHKAAGCVAWIGSGVMILLGGIKKRLILRQGLAPEGKSKGKLFTVIRAFLVFAVIMLFVETCAHTLDWHFEVPQWPSSVDIWDMPQVGIHAFFTGWVYFRANYIAPVLRGFNNYCIFWFLLQSFDRILLALGCVYIKLKGIKPIPVNPSLESDDVEDPYGGHPMVLVQIPMCNEREVFEQSISAVCQLDWPKSRMLIQVLDDSSDVETRFLIKGEVSKWHQKGVNIVYRHREDRTGYKAGNMKAGMQCDYVKDYEFVAIFDADFQPKSDFLKRTVPHFRDNPELALVQTRWSFVNKDENLLTRLQNINLSFHFEVEQQVNGHFLNFFGFNGTAGVWRIKALEESGGWLERTTVEDMDIAVRAHLQGWKFIFLNDVRCLCELPESYEAYRKQQQRWHSGPMQLIKLCFWDIIRAKISWAKKANMICLFFALRKFILPSVSFTLFCIILPMTMFVPEAPLPVWVVCYVPAVMSALNVLPSIKSAPFLIPFLLFENTMSVTKFWAMVTGLLKLSGSHEWVVTKKTGRVSEGDLLKMEKEAKPTLALDKTMSESNIDALKAQDVKLMPLIPAHAAPVKKKKNRLYWVEISLAGLLFAAAGRSLLSAHGIHFYYLLFQAVSFLVVGLDLIGEQVS
ncbi:hypothetical protein M758_8G107500 [Ceratodon purpureus]|uniref:Glycosyltransferase 2-like domain-containing protein n=1 Tax=Ceratodon purpureus TaxID=3225 RepID=A0A8T0H0W1_CERPU|nr:hypothetical protein KC19_8G110900 [Ceratodon purpureus]KAG0608462.1 hypothetical protein M758_8G107500 [Ceratodon purpureus]